jgi:hypothetical protein
MNRQRRRLTIRGTIMAYSFWNSSQATNTARRRMKPAKRPITVLLFQRCVCPPYCSARM